MEKIYAALNKMSYGLYVVSSVFEDKINGQIANTVFQVSPNPPKLAISLHKENLTYAIIKKSGVFSVSVLEKETPMTFIGLFGFKSGKTINKFQETEYKTDGNCPVVTAYSIAYIKAKVIQETDAGTHALFLADILGGEILKDGEPLTYDYYHKAKKGKTHKNATTFNL